MEVGNSNAKEKTTQECIDSLECLFKSYRKDSEFNYQLEVCNSPFNILKKKIHKLDLLEELEKELGVDLITLFKAKTVWCKTLVENKQTKERSYQIIERRLWGINLEYKEIMVGSQYSFAFHKIKDYGKDWALTEEELECHK